MSTTRQAPRALNKSAPQVAANAAAELARKRESKASLKASRKAAEAPSAPVILRPSPTGILQAVETQPKPDKKAIERAAYEKTLREDAEALGLDPDAYVAENIEAEEEAEAPSGHPMAILLHNAAKGYVPSLRGILCNGDQLAILVGAFERKTVVETLGSLLLQKGITTTRNPYAHLNPGQQSMNLRNKARGALKNGLLSHEEVKTAFGR